MSAGNRAEAISSMHRLIKKPSAKGESKVEEEEEVENEKEVEARGGGEPRRAAFDFRLELAGDSRRPKLPVCYTIVARPAASTEFNGGDAAALVNGVWRLKYNGDVCSVESRCTV